MCHWGKVDWTALKKEGKQRSFHIISRHFPLDVAAIRQKTGIKEGGDDYLIFTQTENGQKVMIEARRN
ncbi:MAG: hypothetical protein HC842_06255 [Cytophagales bacterium]|nr:hypothetical protein [Cytophagales bacterium]